MHSALQSQAAFLESVAVALHRRSAHWWHWEKAEERAALYIDGVVLDLRRPISLRCWSCGPGCGGCGEEQPDNGR
jgi:hypothetical protein